MTLGLLLHTTVHASISCQDVKEWYGAFGDLSKSCCADPSRNALLPEGCQEVSLNALDVTELNVNGKAIVHDPDFSMVVTSCNDPSVDESVVYRTLQHQKDLWKAVRALNSDIVLNLGDNWYGDVSDISILDQMEETRATYDQASGQYKLPNGTVETAAVNNYFINSRHKVGLLNSVEDYRLLKNGLVEWDGTTTFGKFEWLEPPKIYATWDDHDYSPNNGGASWTGKCQSKELFLDHFTDIRGQLAKTDGTENVVWKHPAGPGVKNISSGSIDSFCRDGGCDPYKLHFPEKCTNDDPSTTGGIFHGPYKFRLDKATAARSYGALSAWDDGIELELVMLDDHWYRQEEERTEIAEIDREFFGQDQRDFLENIFASSNAYMRFIAIGSPVFTPSYATSDNLFIYPKDNMWLRNMMQKYNLQRTVFLGGDSHSCYIVRDGRFSTIPIVTMVSSGAHSGSAYSASDNANRAYWSGNVAGVSMFANIEVYVTSGIPRIVYTQQYKKGGVYVANDPIVVPLSMLEASYPHEPNYLTHMVTDAEIRVDLSGAMQVGQSGTTFKSEDKVYLTLTTQANEELVAHAPLVQRGNAAAYTGPPFAHKLVLGQSLEIKLEWMRGSGLIATDTRQHVITFINQDLSQMSLLDIQYTAENYIQLSNAIELIDPAGMGQQDIAKLREPGYTLLDGRYSADADVFVTGQLWHSRYQNPPPTTISAIESSDGKYCVFSQYYTFNSLYYGNNVLKSTPGVVTAGNGFPLLRSELDHVIISFRTTMSTGGSFPYNSLYFPDSVDLAAHGNDVEEKEDGSHIPKYFRITKYSDDTGYIDGNGRSDFAGAPWPTSVTVPANSAEITIGLDFTTDAISVFWEGNYVASGMLPSGYKGVAAVMNNPNGQTYMCDMKVYTAAKA